MSTAPAIRRPLRRQPALEQCNRVDPRRAERTLPRAVEQARDRRPAGFAHARERQVRAVLSALRAVCRTPRAGRSPRARGQPSRRGPRSRPPTARAAARSGGNAPSPAMVRSNGATGSGGASAALIAEPRGSSTSPMKRTVRWSRSAGTQVMRARGAQRATRSRSSPASTRQLAREPRDRSRPQRTASSLQQSTSHKAGDTNRAMPRTSLLRLVPRTAAVRFAVTMPQHAPHHVERRLRRLELHLLALADEPEHARARRPIR